MRAVSFAAAILVATAMLVGGCSSSASPSPSSGLTGAAWYLTAITSKTPAFQGLVAPADQGKYSINFATGGTFTGSADCNAISGMYTTSGSNGITITPGPSTLVACADGSFDVLFVQGLGAASTYAVGDGTLTLTAADGATMTFGSSAAAASGAPASSPVTGSPAPAPDLTGKTWKLTAITDKTPAFQGVVPTADVGRYTIEFSPDGTFSAKADCNTVGGSYTTGANGTMTIVPGPSTLVACPPGSLGDLYVVGLSNTASYAIANGALTLTLTDGGTLVHS